MTGVPTIYISLLEAGVRPEALASVRLYKSAAATMPGEVARRWRDTYGQTIVEGYGLTETSPAATFNHEYEYRAGSVGTPVDLWRCAWWTRRTATSRRARGARWSSGGPT